MTFSQAVRRPPFAFYQEDNDLPSGTRTRFQPQSPVWVWTNSTWKKGTVSETSNGFVTVTIAAPDPNQPTIIDIYEHSVNLWRRKIGYSPLGYRY